ncbi:MAG: hypothetical protein WA822_01315 [Albidovulum sp.]
MRPRIGIMRAILSVILMVLPGMTTAETVRIRSGDHPGFSRIVLDLAAPAKWVLGRVTSGYELRLDRAGVEFDTTRIHRAIGRNRIAGVSSDPGVLRLELGCTCHAKAFTTAKGALVIDIVDGSPAPDGPYETILPAQSEPALSGTATELREPELLPVPGSTFQDADTPAVWAPPGPRYRPVSAQPSHLALFWRPDAGALETAVPGAANSPQMADSASQSTRSKSASEARDGLDTPMLPTLPDPRVMAVQNDLLHQLSRATAQGLLEVDIERKRGFSQPGADAHHSTEPASMPDTEPTQVHAETSIDRDMLSVETRPHQTSDGEICLPDDEFDLSDWGDARPAMIQIAERRLQLLGEFDRPSPETVLALARLYVFLGFGAESRAVLKAFALPSETSSRTDAIAAILDGRSPDPLTGLSGMTGCATAAALWAVLSWPSLPQGVDINEAAVQRGFSALPIHLRRSLGPGLSDRLLSAGRDDAARSVRNAITRAPGEAGAGLRIIDAQLDLASGDAVKAEAQLDALASSNDPLSVAALIATIQSRVDRSEPVPHQLADAAEALAFERRNGKDGPTLSHLHVLARGSVGDFDHAFAAYHRWVDSNRDTPGSETARRLFSMLGSEPDGSVFVTSYFQNRAMFEAALPDVVTRLDFAERLGKAGFTSESRILLRGEASRTDRGRRLLAEAALADFDAAEAIAQLAGLEDKSATELRARALALAGDHKSAAAAFAEVGQMETAAKEAWRGGDWGTVRAHGPESMQMAVADFGLGETAATAVPATTPLAQSRALIETSQSIRATLDALMIETAEPVR